MASRANEIKKYREDNRLGEFQVDAFGGLSESEFHNEIERRESDGESLVDRINDLVSDIGDFELDKKVAAINSIRECLHNLSPFKTEPVDFVKWVKCDNVTQNDYNPNKVAPAEMKLLELSIHNDGYTQPIVAWSDSDKDMIEVIDGFHRHRVGKESKAISQRVSKVICLSLIYAQSRAVKKIVWPPRFDITGLGVSIKLMQ